MRSRPTKNLAPVKPLLELRHREDAPDGYLGDQLRELTKDLLARDEETWREVAETSETVSNFTQGKQIFQFNPFAGEWRIQNLRRVNPNKITSINIMQFYLTDNLQRLVSSNPDIEPEETYLRSQYRKKVKQAKAVWNFYEKKFYTHWFNQQEALHAIISGTYIESVQYDHLSNGAVVFQEIFNPTEFELSPGGGTCIDCGHEGGAKDFTEKEIPRCPACGSFAVSYEDPIKEIIDMPSELQPIQMGEPRLKLIPIQGCRFSLKARAEESPYFIERRLIPISRLKYVLGPEAKIPEADQTLDRGLQALENIHRAGNTLFGQQSYFHDYEKKTKDALVDRVSLLPEEYAHIKFAQDEKTLAGETIKAGSRLTDVCPKGLTMFVVGEKHILGLYPNVTHQDEVTSGCYHMRYESGLGRGSEDTVEVQKRFNRFDSQHVKSMESAATPAHTYIEGSIDKRYVKQIGYPNAAIPIKAEVASAMGTTDLITQLKPATVAGNFFQYTYDILNQYRQLTAHSTTFSNGLPGVDNQTATGARIGDANAASIYIPMLQIKSDVRVKTAQKTIQCVHRHFKGVSQFFPYGKTENNQVAGEMISGEQLDPEIRFVVVRDSELPKNRYNKQQDFERMMMAVGGVEGLMMLKMQDPELYGHIQATYGQEIGQKSYSMLEDICRDRLEQAQAMVQMIRMMAISIDPEMAQVPLEQVVSTEILAEGVVPSIVMEEPDHEQKADWYATFLDTPEGYALSPDDRQLVILFARVHLEKAQERAATVGQAGAAAQVMAQAPLAEAEANAQQAEWDNEANLEAQRAEQDMRKAEHDANLEIEKERAKVEMGREDLQAEKNDIITTGSVNE